MRHCFTELEPGVGGIGLSSGLARLAAMLGERNRIEGAIADLIGRPAHVGHMGEYIAARLFDIELEDSATAKGIDGRFRFGTLAGKTVNVKFYPRHSGLLDINPDGVPDYYLVLSGPWVPASSSRGARAPWVIDRVFLFVGHELVRKLQRRGVKIGIATSVIRSWWDEAEIYPEERNPALRVTPAQREMLKLFSSEALDK